MNEVTEETEVDKVTQQAQEIVMLRHVVHVHGQVLDEIAGEARKLVLSGNPAVSAAGTKILGMIPS